MSKRKIEHAKIFGDFFGEGNVNELEDALVGNIHDYTHIKEVMEDYDFYHYFGDIDKDSILKLMAYCLNIKRSQIVETLALFIKTLYLKVKSQMTKRRIRTLAPLSRPTP